MLTFKQFLKESRVKTFHGSHSKFDFSDKSKLPADENQFYFWSSTNKNNSRDYANSASKITGKNTPTIHKVEIRTDNHFIHHWDWNSTRLDQREKVIRKAKRLKHDGVIFKNAPDRSGNKIENNDDIVTWNVDKIRHKGYSK